ncbi:hypothetical protein VFPPC_17849 [Pochonia chlamydosporia 170]|uniref:Uncharacterized protein n=1 Tax=Pochonia chlamydosporia 170 TaxID=1380566 RepID=A0A219AQ86_METCM|nr:hypothetical protein VFPPC_17849 [Pochonia chlamydosporia 170]OWT42958.1 hypothetical protein VFPPC_17849 [Pochonia chlamydosporia 170]
MRHTASGVACEWRKGPEQKQQAKRAFRKEKEASRETDRRDRPVDMKMQIQGDAEARVKPDRGLGDHVQSRLVHVPIHCGAGDGLTRRCSNACMIDYSGLRERE